MKRVTAILAGAFAILGVAVALGWAPDRSVDSLKARWAPSPSVFLTVDGLSIHLRDEGPSNDPRPIVFIHGTSSSLHTWDGWTAALKNRHRVVRFDLPGAGLSDQFGDDDYRMERYVRFTAQLLDSLQIRNAILVGNSLGGRIGWEIATGRPDLVSRLVLIDAVGYPQHNTEPPLAVWIAQIPLIGAPIIEHITPRVLVEKSLKVAYGDPARLTPAIVDRYYELLLRAGNRRALTLQLQQESYEDWSRIGKVAVPTLILWGRLDRVVPVGDAERFHRDIANSRLVVFDALGHVPQEEAAAESLKPLEAFLEQEASSR